MAAQGIIVATQIIPWHTPRVSATRSTHEVGDRDAFRETRPTTTVAKWEDGQTSLRTVSGEDLDFWLKEYSLGSLFKSGELEDMG